jgi:hypothetical protein
LVVIAIIIVIVPAPLLLLVVLLAMKLAVQVVDLLRDALSEGVLTPALLVRLHAQAVAVSLRADSISVAISIARAAIVTALMVGGDRRRHNEHRGEQSRQYSHHAHELLPPRAGSSAQVIVVHT